MTSPLRAPFPLVGLLAAAWILVIDLTTRITVAGQTLSALLTMAMCIALGGVVLLNELIVLTGGARAWTHSYQHSLRAIPWPLVAFLVFAAGSLLVRPSVGGIQNVVSYAMFVFAIAAAAGSVRLDYSRVGALLLVVGVIASLVFLTELATGVLLYGARGYAMTCLVLLAISVPASHTERRRTVTAWLLPIFFAVVLTLSLSRTATATGALMLCFLALRATQRHRRRIAVLTATAVASAAAIAVLVYPPLLERFIGGDNAVELNGVSLNTSGRTLIWDLVWNSALTAPWLGHGPGHSAAIVSASFTDISQPHNDYLRIFNDFGIVGVVLFWGGIFWLLVRLWRLASRTNEMYRWSGFLALSAICAMAITDNVLVYQFVLLPAGVLIGMALRPSLGPVRPAHPPAQVTRHSRPRTAERVAS